MAVVRRVTPTIRCWRRRGRSAARAFRCASAADPGAEQLGDADLARAGDDLERLVRTDRARRANGQIEAAPGLRPHRLGGVPEAHRGVELEAGEARLADGEDAVRKAQHIADPDVRFE